MASGGPITGGPVFALVRPHDRVSGTHRADTPLLLIHGDSDERVRYQSSVEVFALANPPKYFLTLVGEGHTGAYNGGDRPVEVLVPQASLDFFDAYLKGDDAALERLTTESDVPGVATLQAEPPE